MSIENHFEDIQSKIARKLLDAERQILVAVSWLTDQKLYNILCTQAESLIDVQVLILKDEININSSIDYEKLVRSGGKLYWQENISNSLMHHKFCIIDKNTVITGSYNWTNKAQSNFENILILENEQDNSINYYNEFINLVPKFQDAIFFEPGYIPAEFFNTPERRLHWFEKLSDKVKSNFLYHGRQLLFKYDEEGYVSYSDNLDENIEAIFKMSKILFTGEDTLEPLENLSNLEEITIAHNKRDCLDITPLRNLINLKVLKLSGNKISDLRPLSKLKKLKRLDLSNCHIDSLYGLGSLTNLTDLNLSNNKISSLDEISEFTKLEYLKIQNNNIEHIDFLLNNKRLSELRMDDNVIRDISCLSNCVRLQKLDFSNNKVEDIVSIQDLKLLIFVNGKNNLISNEKIKHFKKNLKSPHYEYNINL